jgi:adenylate cyclase
MAADTSHGATSTGQPWLLGSRLRQLRLATGLVLFAYVLTHLLNHALLNISIATADRVLLLQKFIWQGVIGTTLLYGALTIHASLGLWALYARRQFRWTAAEAFQLLLGLSLPAMLVNHVCVTRISYALYSLNKGYVAELNALWVATPPWGWLQIGVLTVAWTHACLGLFFLLRLRRWWPAAQAPLAAAAVLLPVLALLGFAAGGRELARALADSAYRVVNLPVGVTGNAAQKASLAALRNWFLIAYGAAIAGVLLGRLVRHVAGLRRGKMVVRYPGGTRARVARGIAVLDASRLHAIPHAAVCGGRGRCSTCRIRVLWSAEPLPPPAPHERQILDHIGADADTVRLACQLHPTADLAVVPLIPPEIAGDFVLGRAPRIPGDERFLAAMFIDLRGSAGLVARHMPFDSVFLVGRFITTITRAVVRSGGRPVQFLGDGVLALFGLECLPERACRDALAAVRAVETELANLAPVFDQEAGVPLRYGIGLHCGRAIVGEIGFGQHVAFTALGETINLAHRLQELARDLEVAAVISEAVFTTAGTDPSPYALLEATPRGHGTTLKVRTVELDGVVVAVS